MVKIYIFILAVFSSVLLFGCQKENREENLKTSNDATKNVTEYINDNTSATADIGASAPERPIERQNAGLPSGPPSDMNALQMNAQF
jgi:hypothetical protein